MDNNNQQKAYLSVLENSSIKKNDILDQLMKLTKEQEEIIKAENVDDERFDEIIDEKESLIQKIVELNAGFNQVYKRIQEELVVNKGHYGEEIQRLQKLILEITDKGVQLQVLEKRNKAKLELYFKNKRKDIRELKLGNDTVTNYYKNMNNQNQNSSYFFDKKN